MFLFKLESIFQLSDGLKVKDYDTYIPDENFDFIRVSILCDIKKKNLINHIKNVENISFCIIIMLESY